MKKQALSIMDRVKTVEDASNVLERVVFFPDLSILPERDAKHLLTFYKLLIVTEALNEGWQPDPLDFDEYKWFAWWYIVPEETSTGTYAGLRTLSTIYRVTGAGAGCTFRLCFKTEALARYAATQFEDLYRDFIFA